MNVGWEALLSNAQTGSSDGTRQALSTPGIVLDKTYRLIEELGKGGFGSVHLALRIGSEGNGPVAIKILNKNKNLDASELLRFQREAVLMAQLNHPGIVTVYELGEAKENLYIVMEFIRGKNLKEFSLSREGRLQLAEIIDIIAQCAEALEYVHSAGIIHRDIKPQNILISDFALTQHQEKFVRVKIVDFGVARIGLANKDEFVGTYAYMSPESTGLLGNTVDFRSDIYSLGVVAFELLAGRVPFVAAEGFQVARAHAFENPPKMSEVKGREFSPILEKFVAKCLQKKPEDRYQSMFSLLCDLKRIQKTESLEDFTLAQKVFGGHSHISNIFVSRKAQFESLRETTGKLREPSRLTWHVVQGAVGTGKTSLLKQFVKEEQKNAPWLEIVFIRFSESERRLPLQSFSFAFNEYLAFWFSTRRQAQAKIIETLDIRLGEDFDVLKQFLPCLRRGEPRARKTLPEQEVEKKSHSLQNEKNEILSDAGHMHQGLPSSYLLFIEKVSFGFFELMSILSKEYNPLVFMFDDLQNADPETLTLLQFFAEKVNDKVQFSFVCTLRTVFVEADLKLGSFLRKLSQLKRRAHFLEIFPFTMQETESYLESIGVQNSSKNFVKFCQNASEGNPLNLGILIKQMVMADVLVASKDSAFFVSEGNLKFFVPEIVSVELVADAVAELEERDLLLLQIAAVCGTACFFEWFRVSDEFSSKEIEVRLESLVRRSFLEKVSDSNIPLARSYFQFVHEKIRKKIIDVLVPEKLEQIHFLLAKRLESIYKNPKAENFIAIARHYDGCIERDVLSATKYFLKAANIFIRTAEYEMAKYYLQRFSLHVNSIGNLELRLQRLREGLDSKYQLNVAEGNLVQASDVLRELIEQTQDPDRTIILKVFWAQLLLSMGQFSSASRVLLQVLEADTPRVHSRRMSLYIWMLQNYLGKKNFSYFLKVFEWFCPKPFPLLKAQKLPSENAQVICLLVLSLLHSEKKGANSWLAAGYCAKYLKGQPTRWSGFFGVLWAIKLLKLGHSKESYRVSELAIGFLERSRADDFARWSKVLVAIWIDYPMGKLGRLVSLLEGEGSVIRAKAGLLHYESLALRGWLRLIAPQSKFAKKMDGAEDFRRRKSDKNDSMDLKAENHGSSESNSKKETETDDVFFQNDAQHIKLKNKGGFEQKAEESGWFENKNARRLLDAGEGSQFTALSLFSDAMRFAICDKPERLRRTFLQMKSSRGKSIVYDVLSISVSSLLNLLSGNILSAKEDISHLIHDISSQKDLLLTPMVADSLRVSILVPYLMSLSQQKNIRQEDWKESSQADTESFATSLFPNSSAQLAKVLHVLKSSRGIEYKLRNSVKRTSIDFVFEGFCLLERGEITQALPVLDKAFTESKISGNILCESISILALAIARFKLTGTAKGASAEQMSSCAQMYRERQWISLLRMTREFAARMGITNFDEDSFAQSVESLSQRQSLTNKAAQEILSKFKNTNLNQSEFEIKKTVAELALKLVSGHQAWVIGLRQSNSKVPKYGSDVKVESSEHVLKGVEVTNILEQKLLNLIPANANEPFVVLGLQDFLSQGLAFQNVLASPARNSNQFSDLEDTAIIASANSKVGLSNEKTLASGKTFGNDKTMASPSGSRSEQLQAAQRSLGLGSTIGQGLILLVAITHGTSLFGWVAVLCEKLAVNEATEQDFLILGLHTGFLLHKNRMNQPIIPSENKVSFLQNSHSGVEENEKKPQEFFEQYLTVVAWNKLTSNIDVGLERALNEKNQFSQRGIQISDFGKKRKAIFLWNVVSESTESLEVLQSLLLHLKIMCEALSQSLVYQSLANINLRFSAEISSLVSTATKSSFDLNGSLLKNFDFNVICFDFASKDFAAENPLCVCSEAIFGDELFALNGKTRLISENTKEIPGVIDDRIWYVQERVRTVKKEKFGWLGYPQKGRMNVFSNFVKANVLEELNTKSPLELLQLNSKNDSYLLMTGEE